MAKDTGKSAKIASRKSAFRRSVLRGRGQAIRQRINTLLDSPSFGWGLMTSVVFALICGALVAWAREQPMLSTGRVMSDTRTVRVPFTTIDEQQTETNRESARQRTPRVYQADSAVLDEVLTSLRNLPRTLAGVEGVDQVETTIRDQFHLTDERILAMQGFAGDDTYEDWGRLIDGLRDVLRRRPMLDAQAWQRATQQTLSPQIKLSYADGTWEHVALRDVVNIGDAQSLTSEARNMVRVAGLEGAAAEVAEHRLTTGVRPTFQFDAEATGAAQDAAADAVTDARRTVAVGQKIYERGDTLSPSQYELAMDEAREFSSQGSFWIRWTRRAGAMGGAVLITLMLAGYIASFSTRISSRPARMGWLGVVIGGSLCFSLIGTAIEPRAIMLTGVAPTLLVAAMITIAYNQRVALAVGGCLALLTGIGLSQPIESLLLVLVGVAVAVWRLKELRDRRTLVSMSVTLGAALVIGALLVSAVDRPVTRPDWTPWALQAVKDAALAGFGGLLVGGVTLFILPVVERVFDITTGMTLIELRDPKQPLLREMQQRAPGTYNHSLNVASIAENAADAVGADSLLTYVGCLYHDIGKVNKPEYFVENQSGGANKHDKLSPAMSLLVIVGHVKDGMAMARQHGLPRSLQHFIEAHHGTTLVEYFYKRARKQAIGVDDEGHEQPSTGEPAVEIEGERLPEEVDYRYPGPKPQTKEVAIVMLSDAVESATRTLAEPTPARIDSLVRDLANRRLMDGQFDECDLTLADLRAIVESISKTVASIYHGRISYTEEKKPDKAKDAPEDGDGRAERSA